MIGCLVELCCNVQFRLARERAWALKKYFIKPRIRITRRCLGRSKVKDTRTFHHGVSGLYYDHILQKNGITVVKLWNTKSLQARDSLVTDLSDLYVDGVECSD